MLAAAPDRVTEFVCDGTVGLVVLVVAIWGLLALFRRNPPDDSRDKPRRW